MSRFRGWMLVSVALAIAPAAAPGQSHPAPASPPVHLRFSFGSQPAPGYTRVPPEEHYSAAAGYGFENAGGIFPTAVATAADNPLHSGYITGIAPAGASNAFFFSVKVPEGNYRVTITLGGASHATETTVRAELRRLMLERIKAGPGEFVTRTFAVNVRQPPIRDAAGKQVGVVKLSSREVLPRSTSPAATAGAFPTLNRTPGGEGWAWDDTLTLEFVGDSAVSALTIDQDDTIRTVFLCGDSTVCDQPAEPYTSWGQVITRWIKPEYAVANYALSGNTAAAFYAANRMQKILSLLHPGDFVFVQYGHNDMKSTAAGALDSYKNYYRRFIDDTRSKGATPVMLTPVSRKTFGPDGRITNSFLVRGTDDYLGAVRAVVQEKQAPFIDLNARSALFYETVGRANIQGAFATAAESTHHGDWGAYEIAKCVVQGIVDLKLPLARSLTDDWPGYDPAKPDALADYHIPGDPLPAAAVAPPVGN